MRLPASGCSATDLLQDTVGSGRARLPREPRSRAPRALRHRRRERRRGRPEKRLTPAYAHCPSLHGSRRMRPTGAVQPAASARRNTRSAVVSARARGSSIAARSSRIALVVVAALDSRAPLSRRGEHRLGLQPLAHANLRARDAGHRPQPGARRRTRPLAPCGSACPRSRESSGRRDRAGAPLSCACAAQAARADDRARAGARRGRARRATTRQSRTSSRAQTAPSATPGVASVGRSLSEWTARSIVPSCSACSSSAVKRPLPPIAGSGRRWPASGRRVVAIGVILQVSSGHACRRESLTRSVCALRERRRSRAEHHAATGGAAVSGVTDRAERKGPNSSRIAARASSASPAPARCAQAHRRLVQELLHESAREMLDPLCRLRVDVTEIAQRLSTSARRIASACRRIDATSGSTSSSR